MSQFNIYSIQNAPLAAQPLLDGAQQKFGFLPNLLGGLAESPAVLQAYLNLGVILDKTSLTPVEQQVVLLAASVENHCIYCVAVHSMLAKHKAKADAAIVDALREQQPLPDKKLDALATFTRAVVEQRGKVTGIALDNFIAAGYSRSQVLEVVLGVTMKTLSNYANHIIHAPLDSQFKAEEWNAPTQCNKQCA
ncbi:MAG: carboxymuconolactone decarboxylase family protein [Methylobacter sp.]|uniref:carboxymuconolactone decarboxylase family protein n=1 Tax=Methylobacter sp. TaxID=2051955 RepID=UPI00272F209A|nr:carboxymuconolactone decarboxylase family protein [Methylobacter sp.]MDP1665254.1 carboxymuconolactone decarboxylase family protein [Methylobacter sp.]